MKFTVKLMSCVKVAETLYFRVSTRIIDVGTKLLQYQGDCDIMVGYGKQNNYRIDTYVEHYTEHRLSAKDYENVHFEEYASGQSNEFVDLKELDEDYYFSDSEYLMGEGDDREYAENVDQGT